VPFDCSKKTDLKDRLEVKIAKLCGCGAAALNTTALNARIVVSEWHCSGGLAAGTPSSPKYTVRTARALLDTLVFFRPAAEKVNKTDLRANRDMWRSSSDAAA
jgi:hypothetical protein